MGLFVFSLPLVIIFNSVLRQGDDTHIAFAIIQNARSSNKELNLAIDKISTTSESPKFWADIANDATYSNDHRKTCIYQLFRRHVHSGMRISDLASVLSCPIWLQRENIFVVNCLSGVIPVSISFEDTVLLLSFFPESGTQMGMIFLRVSGETPIGSERTYCDSFFQMLSLSETNHRKTDAIIREVGFYTPISDSE